MDESATLFQNQNNLSISELIRHARELGLNAETFNTCLDSGTQAGVWQRSKALGETYGIGGTPTFFVNGIPLYGALPAQEFYQVIEDELRRLANDETAISHPAVRSDQPIGSRQ